MVEAPYKYRGVRFTFALVYAIAIAATATAILPLTFIEWNKLSNQWMIFVFAGLGYVGAGIFFWLAHNIWQEKNSRKISTEECV